MDNTMNKDQHDNCCCNHCNCQGMGGMGRHRGNFVLRLFLGLVILLVVFWMGIQIGEFKGSLENGGFYGHGFGMRGNVMYRTMGSPAQKGFYESTQVYPGTMQTLPFNVAVPSAPSAGTK